MKLFILPIMILIFSSSFLLKNKNEETTICFQKAIEEADSLSPFLKSHKFEIQKAYDIYREIEPEFITKSNFYETDPKFLAAIVYPELIRFSKLKDFVETSLLEQIYVSKGSEAANFSIGLFQMKPSFVEQLESKVRNNTTLKQFDTITKFYSKNIKEIRRERLSRLKNIEWQINY